MHNSKKIKISVITPTYNREKDIVKCINSVKNQDFAAEYEHIIIDDCSTDKTNQRIRKMSDRTIKYLKNKKNMGVNYSRNQGIKTAKGDCIIFLDSDDRLTKDAFRTIMSSRLDKINFFGTKEEKSGRRMSYVKEEKKYNYKDWLEKKRIYGEFLPVVKRGVLKEERFDENRFCFESFFWNKIIKRYGVKCFRKILRIYQFSDDSISKEIINEKHSYRRYQDYRLYLDYFEKDYKRYSLYDQLNSIYSKTIYYGLLSDKERKQVRRMITNRLKYKKDLGGLGLEILYYMPKGLRIFLNIQIRKMIEAKNSLRKVI